MNIYRLFFPSESRSFKGKRWLRISLRTIHLVGTAGLGGGFLYQAPKEFWMPYLMLTVLSGFAIMLLEIWSSAIWLIQLRGIAITIKLILLSCLNFAQDYAAYVLVIAVIISGIISHAPGDVRYFSIFHGRRIDDM